MISAALLLAVILVEPGHGTWFLYRIWNPFLLGTGHGIWWFLYRIWNPFLLGTGHWLFRVLLALVAVQSVADAIKVVFETLAIGAMSKTIYEWRERRKLLRQRPALTKTPSGGRTRSRR